MTELITKDQALDAILCEPPEARYPSWYADRIMKLEPVEDLISRQTAISEINMYLHDLPLSDQIKYDLIMIIQQIEE